MDKYGSEYLEDVLITRNDGSRFIIHELISDIDDLRLFEIKEINNKNLVEDKKLVYMNDLDYSKLQSEKDYLDCLADSLLSKERIAAKKLLSNELRIKRSICWLCFYGF